MSTEGGTVRSPNASARNSYYGGSPYIMMPMQHFSFNNSFSYGSEEKLYPDYYAYKWNEKNDMINKRIFEINYDVIEKDPRTTVMIKNIPNKYSLKLLSDEIDEKHANTYDFLYLPFDFDVSIWRLRTTAMWGMPSSTSCLWTTSGPSTRASTARSGSSSGASR